MGVKVVDYGKTLPPSFENLISTWQALDKHKKTKPKNHVKHKMGQHNIHNSI